MILEHKPKETKRQVFHFVTFFTNCDFFIDYANYFHFFKNLKMKYGPIKFQLLISQDL